MSMKAMKRLDIIIRPEKLEKLKEILEKKDYSGMTVFTARVQVSGRLYP